MKLVNDSTVYKFMLKDKESTLNTYRNEIVNGGMHILNADLAIPLANMKKIYRDRLTQLAVDAVASGKITLYAAKDPKHCMPSYMPFIKYKTGDGPQMAVDLTAHAQIKPIRGTENLREPEYEVTIEPKKLYAFVVSAYLYLYKFDRSTFIPSKLAKSCAIVWAKLFCKILEMKVGLATNRDRHDAFMYFAMMFFLMNILEYNEEPAKAIAKSYFKVNTTNATIGQVETTVADQNINMYESFETFCRTMFDPTITGLRTMRLKNSNDVITVEYYVAQYITMYHVTSAFSLAAFPYFIWMIISACNWAYLFNDKAIESVAADEYNTIMTELYKMV